MIFVERGCEPGSPHTSPPAFPPTKVRGLRFAVFFRSGSGGQWPVERRDGPDGCDESGGNQGCGASVALRGPPPRRGRRRASALGLSLERLENVTPAAVAL